MRTVLFLCTGNYYRSRFAEAVFNHHAQRNNLPWQAISRGLNIDHPENTHPISPHTRKALEKRGIAPACTGPDKVALTPGDLESAELVVALKETEHRPMVRRLFPAYEGRIRYWEIHDLDGYAPEQALPAIETLVQELLAELRAI